MRRYDTRATLAIGVAIALSLASCQAINGALSGVLVPDRQLPDKGPSNDVHAKRVGQIVFASKPIDFKSPDESSFKNDFSQNDYVFARFYLKESMENSVFHAKRYKPSYPAYKFVVSVDGAVQDIVFKDNMNEASDTTKQLWIRIPRGRSGWGETGEWVKFVNAKLAPGKHLVRLDLMVEDVKAPVASGEFSLTKAKEKMPYGTSFKDYQAGMVDKALEKSLLDLLKKKLDWGNEKWMGVKIKSEDWTPTKNDLGILLNHRMEGWAYSVRDDGSAWVRIVYFGQSYVAGEFSKSLEFYEYENGEAVDPL